MAHKDTRAAACLGGCFGAVLALLTLPAATAAEPQGVNPEHPGGVKVAALGNSSVSRSAELMPPALAAGESALRQAAQAALWPADIVQRCADYLRLYPQHTWAADARHLHDQAQRTADLLRRADVQLFRGAFDATRGVTADDAEDLRRAALGDAAAALRQASAVAERDERPLRRLGWLQYAAVLGSDRAAYELALHYRRASQPLLAARYEARAIELGFEPPVSLDHRRH